MTAVITGASAGLGAEFATQLAADGHDLVLVARNETRLSAYAKQLHTQYGVDVEVLAADLSQDTGIDRVVRRLTDPDRPITMLVNNAGFGVPGDICDSLPDDLNQMITVMCTAVLRLSQAAACSMRDQGTGTIINVSSVAGWTTRGVYAACKAWTTTFTESLALELAGTGVGVTALCPGFVRTEFHGRAAIDTTSLPSYAWLHAADVVRDSLRDARRGKVLSIPDIRYKALVLALQHIPRPLLRNVRLASLAKARRANTGQTVIAPTK